MWDAYIGIAHTAACRMWPWLPRGITLGETNWPRGRENYDSRGGCDVIARMWGEADGATVIDNVLLAKFEFSLVTINYQVQKMAG